MKEPSLDRFFQLPEIRHIGPQRPLAWIGAGWRDLKNNPIASLAYGLLFAIAGDVILIFSWRNPYLFTAAVSGFVLVAPLLAGGLYEISRRHANGLTTTFVESLAAWRRNGQSIAMFGLLLALAAIIWERTSAVIFAILVPGLTPDLWGFIGGVLLNPDHVGLTLVWLAVGGLLATLVFGISAISVPMLIDRDTDFVTAMMTSLRSVARNPFVMLEWAVIVVILTVAGFASLLFGLVVLIPILGHASWHAYRDLVE